MRGMSALFFLGCLVAFALLNAAALTQPYNESGYEEFGYMKLALQWPASHCQIRSCEVAIPPDFTIHGLWPDNYSGWFPLYCYKQPYVPITNNVLLQRLRESWPDLERKNNPKFWSDEWKKHGTCSLRLYNQMQYFEKALDLKGRYGLIQYMKTKGVSPGPKTYSAKTIIGVVQGLIGVVPEVHCEKQKTSGKQFLAEIRICFDPSGANAIDCPASRSRQCSGNALFPALPA
ncbi:Ribonuclease T(2) [Bertholletia excelsa]